ncbi:MAG TPA: glycosyltransferase [Gammaproteobacteria bacterium]|jgi:exo-beta-1,3-glucanase (GH17 family)/cellulose synthase/poly-beta-1,6-N-acetylglucosamine synthase-like glycosyltransferase
MTRSGLIYPLLVAVVTAALWRYVASPSTEPPAPAILAGLSFSPLDRGQRPERAQPSIEELDADLTLVAAHTKRIRTYAVDGTLAEIAALAERHGLEVTLGVALDPRDWASAAATNAARLRRLVDIAEHNRNVTRVIVGNESILAGDWTVAELAPVLDELREELAIPVGTAEPWNVWAANPTLAEHVDFIAVHLLPYWEGIDARVAVDHVAARMRDLQAQFPDKPVVIGEVGWPSFGRARDAAAASERNAVSFARRFVRYAETQGYDYFYLEAFDQPWKRAEEGEVGAYWGIYDVDRALKLDLWSSPHAPILDPVVLVSIVLALCLLALLFADGTRLDVPGRVFLAVVASLVTPPTVASVAVHVQQYWTPLGVLSSAALFAGLLGILVLLLVEAHEWAEALWSRHRAHAALPPVANDDRWPKVSIHVPVYAEPPEMLIETLRALAVLDYPRFEVLVIDNNTGDERLWRPVESHCARLGERFRFFHVAPLAGYKAGALNFALQNTASDAAIIAVVDSDYCVDPTWLRELVPQFARPNVAIVQAPQAYRDGDTSGFKTLCDSEYRGFFALGMVTRDDRNAIIQHGTMTLIRKSALESAGGWAEWTITEDAELGLRLLEHGHEAVYTPHCYGRGLTPDNFSDYRAQRFRWAFGAVQILRRHGRKLLGLEPSRLTLGQRFHYLTGWLAWLGDGANLVCNIVAIGWSAFMIALPEGFLPPLAAFSTFMLGLFVFKLLKVIVLYRARVTKSSLETIAAVVAGLALVHVVGRAVLAGLVSRETPFLRTPKRARRHSLVGALLASRAETLLAAALLAAAAGVALTAPYPSLDRTVWCAVLLAMSVPHLAALLAAVLSALPERSPRATRARLATTRDPSVWERL